MIEKLVLLFFVELVIYNQVGNALSNQDIEIVKAEVQHYLVARDGELITRQNDLEERVRILEDKVEKLEELSRLGTLRSCAEYAQYGLKTSGLYMIDPDGPLLGDPPFQVFCNFTSGESEFYRIFLFKSYKTFFLGSTEVMHDTEQLTEVEHCPEPGK